VYFIIFSRQDDGRSVPGFVACMKLILDRVTDGGMYNNVS